MRVLVNIDVPEIAPAVEFYEAVVARAVAAGAKRESERIEWRGSKCVTFSDPFGHGFCLIELCGDRYE